MNAAFKTTCAVLATNSLALEEDRALISELDSVNVNRVSGDRYTYRWLIIGVEHFMYHITYRSILSSWPRWGYPTPS